MLRVVSDFISFTGEFCVTFAFHMQSAALARRAVVADLVDQYVMDSDNVSVVMVKQTKAKQALLSCILCRVETNNHPLESEFHCGWSLSLVEPFMMESRIICVRRFDFSSTTLFTH
uniref:Uncharacterized protein n=1 Tax=Solanum lycopersicum TaxID=4081 RepID=A0A3Q7I8S2_SOLLC